VRCATHNADCATPGAYAMHYYVALAPVGDLLTRPFFSIT